DISQLARLFLERGEAHQEPTSAFMLGLLARDWPFNVRELEAAIKRAVALADGGPIDEAHLPPVLDDEPEPQPSAPASGEARTRAPSEAELRVLLERHGGNVAALAREL